MEIEIGVVIQAVLIVAGLGATYATTRTQSSNNTRALANNAHEFAKMRKRIEILEKERLTLLSREEVESHYVTKMELSLTMRNMDLKLEHIEKNQAEMLNLLKQKGN